MAKQESCPICGAKVRRETADALNSFTTGYTLYYCPLCKDAPEFKTLKSWNQYAAAMELAKTEVKLYNSLNSGNYDSVEAAQEDISNAEQRVLEVFNG